MLKKLLTHLLQGPQKMTFLCILVICAMYGIVMLSQKTKQMPSGVVKSVGKPQIGGPFRLKAAGGEIFTEENLKNKLNLIFFGFTHCPDICPTELAKLSRAIEGLPAKTQQNIQVIFISLDPARDNPEQLKNYVTSFDKRFVGLTGTPEQIKHITNTYLVYYAIHKPEEGKAADDYNVDHSGYTYLMGGDGAYITHFSTHTDINEMIQTIKKAHKGL